MPRRRCAYRCKREVTEEMRKALLLLLALCCAAGFYAFSPREKETARAAEAVRVGQVRVLQTEQAASPVLLRVYDEGRLERVDLEEYLLHAVAGEMPASYEMEALKAQAVAARSYIAWKMPAYGGGGCSRGVDADVCTDSTHCLAYWSEEEMRAHWGADYGAYRARVEEAVRATRGEVLLYEGSPVQALFHASSGGYTEDAQAVWGTAFPYLTSVESADGAEAETRFSLAELAEKLNAAFPGAKLTEKNVKENFLVRSRTDSGRADVVRVGEVTATGKAVRVALDLKSTDFAIDYEGDEAVLRTRGSGHGVGMSQVGAEAMAAQGSGYREILAHYYTGVDFGSLPEV